MKNLLYKSLLDNVENSNYDEYENTIIYNYLTLDEIFQIVKDTICISIQNDEKGKYIEIGNYDINGNYQYLKCIDEDTKTNSYRG